jgi:hypothetical protein
MSAGIGLREVYRGIVAPHPAASETSDDVAALREAFEAASASPLDADALEAWLMTATRRAVEAVLATEVRIGTGVAARLAAFAADLEAVARVEGWALHPEDAALLAGDARVEADPAVPRGTVRALTADGPVDDRLDHRLDDVFAATGWL